ncbi:MAG: hypothetical protein HY074_16140 [Deltaproteobacteria bacterium]|nr:hypothetical protein [Deltaproteobacteria bacterium]
MLTRIPAIIKVNASGQLLDARIVVSELTNAGAECFVNRFVAKGEPVTLVFEQPHHFAVKGLIVAWYTFTTSTRVLGPDVFRYRVGIKFQFASPAELEALKNYRSVLQ